MTLFELDEYEQAEKIYQQLTQSQNLIEGRDQTVWEGIDHWIQYEPLELNTCLTMRGRE